MAKTGFIIGAGASADYEMPTGSKLRDEIIQSLSSIQKIISQGIEDLTSERYSKFCRCFEESNINSIDKFLKYHNEFIIEGKAAITYILKKYEDKNYRNVFSSANNNWIHYIYNQLTSSILTLDDYEKIKKNNLYFCTFNYDRLLEFSFSKALYNSFNQILEIRHVFIKDSYRGILDFFNIDIDHMYGRIGDLKNNNMELDLSKTKISTYYNDILLINEREREMTEIIDKLLECDNIFFLGYGFNEENNKLLDLVNITNRAMCYSTAVGLLPEECERIKSKGIIIEFLDNTDSTNLLRRKLLPQHSMLDVI